MKARQRWGIIPDSRDPHQRRMHARENLDLRGAVGAIGQMSVDALENGG